jgi:cobalt-zinc-cadmium efflux system protein
MGHDGHDHTANARDANRRALTVVLALTASFTVVEIIGGLLTESLALLADAGHMLSDNFSLGVALFAAWLAGRPATPEKSFGYRRAEILAALTNGMTLVAISVWVFAEAYVRLREPAEVLGTPMLAVATLGLLVNAAGAIILYRSRGESLNVEGALRHVLADAPWLGRRDGRRRHYHPHRLALRRPPGQRRHRTPDPG